MDWLKWVIPLIGVIVWILSNLAKSQQEQARRNMSKETPRPANPEERESEPRKRPPEKLAEYLEEIRQRKQRDERSPRPATPPPLPVVYQAKATHASRQVMTAAGHSAESEMTQRPPRLPPPLPPIQGAIIVAEAVDSPRHTLPDTAAATVDRHRAKVTNTLFVLLRNRQTLATGILLNEVLGPPRCRRPIRK